MDFNRFKRGISHNSTGPSSNMAGSMEPTGQPQDNRNMQGSLDGVNNFANRPSTAQVGGNSFANKIGGGNKFQSRRTSNLGASGIQGLSSSNNPALRPQTG